MKKVLIAIAACGLLTGCANFNPQALHDAYQKTRDSYTFCKDAYSQIRDDAAAVLQDIDDFSYNLGTDLEVARKDFNNAAASLGRSFDNFKSSTTIKEFSEKE